MSLLFNTHPLVINPQLAEKIGLNEAIVLQQIHYWLGKDSIGVQRHGKHWIYSSYNNWAKQFPFWSESTIKRVINNLKDKGFIDIEQLNKHKHDQTNYYSICYEQLGHNDTHDKVNMTPSVVSKCTDVTENTTENTTKINTSPTSVSGESKPKTDYCDEFEWIWKNKPERQGSNGKKSAYNACRARIKAGSNWRELAEGVVRYAKHCKTEGKLGTQYVMQMTTFFGPDEHYKNEWTTTSSTNTNHKSESTLPTAQEVMSETSTKSLSEAERKKLEQESKTVFSSLWEDA